VPPGRQWRRQAAEALLVRWMGSQEQELKTLFLCDYIAEASLRVEIDRLLNRGEAVHVLQRAIHGGSLAPKRGRTQEQLAAISGALTLLANIVIYWNARRMDDALRSGGADAAPEHLARIAPIGFAHINLRGRFLFNAEPALQSRVTWRRDDLRERLRHGKMRRFSHHINSLHGNPQKLSTMISIALHTATSLDHVPATPSITPRIARRSSQSDPEH
jgi:hypothetical protein